MHLFASDLHLSPRSPGATALFLDFLAGPVRQAEALYILGDLFEVWVGDDVADAWHRNIIAALRQTSDAGVRLYVMHGNRDFALGEAFAAAAGVQLIPDPFDLHLDRLDNAVSASSDVVVLDPVDPKRGTANTLDLDLALVMGDDVAIDGFGLSGTLGGSLRVRAVPGRDMRGTGALDVGGRYAAYGQRLQITRGRLLWSNTLVEDPVLDIRAERVVGEVTAGIRVEGRASAPRATVYSDPAKSESEALAYLTLGRPLSSLSGDEARQLGTAKSALNAGTGLLAAELGARIGLDDAGVTESRALGSDVLSVGKYLSPKLYVGYGVSLLGTGQVLMLKYLLRKGYDIQVESSTVENRASVNWRKEK